MHNLTKYGNTKTEMVKDRIKNCYIFNNITKNSSMDIILANTIKGLNKFLSKKNIDLIVVHGDRTESLAGALCGCLNNIKVAHIEGGEISGTVDEILRHSISKLSHLHFVTNKIAKNTLLQMGENNNNIFVIGSPDVDIILKKNLNISLVKKNITSIFRITRFVYFTPLQQKFQKLNIKSIHFLKCLRNLNLTTLLYCQIMTMAVKLS